MRTFEGFELPNMTKAVEVAKVERYRSQVRPLVVELRGPLRALGRTLLEDLAAEASLARPHGPPPALLPRRWRRELEVTLAFEMAEALRAAPEDPTTAEQLKPPAPEVCAAAQPPAACRLQPAAAGFGLLRVPIPGVRRHR